MASLAPLTVQTLHGDMAPLSVTYDEDTSGQLACPAGR